MKNVKFLAILFLLFALKANAAFTENARRYLNPRDIFNVLTQKFPVVTDRAKIKAAGLHLNCWAIVASNVNVIGVVNPAIGKSAADLPPPGYVRWFGSCGHKIVQMQITDMFAQPLNEKLWAKYWPQDLLKQFRDTGNLAEPYHRLGEIHWADLDEKTRQSLAQFTVTELIGPEPVIHDLGYAKNLQEVSEAVVQTVSDAMLLKEALHNILLAAMMREEFQSY